MIGRVFDFLFPLECIACGAAGAHCCTECAASVPMLPKFWRTPELRTWAAFAYGHPLVRRLIHDLKFEGWTCAMPALERLTRRWAAKIGSGFVLDGTTIVPVPLHPRRLRERGFNQALQLATVLASALGANCREDWLERVVRTKPQTATVHRVRNVQGAFHARVPRSFRDRPILLVDDVWTTGATMGECAKALRAAGAGPILGFALAWGNAEKEKQT